MNVHQEYKLSTIFDENRLYLILVQIVVKRKDVCVSLVQRYNITELGRFTRIISINIIIDRRQRNGRMSLKSRYSSTASSGLLIHRSGCSHMYSDLKVKMEFEEIKIRI